VAVTERGTFFGYGDLVVDMRSFARMRRRRAPVIFDGTHSVQRPAARTARAAATRSSSSRSCWRPWRRAPTRCSWRCIRSRSGAVGRLEHAAADDLADLPVFRRAGLAVAVANAVPEVLAEASFVTTRRGGQGAVREFAEALLKARGQWRELVEQYVARRDRPAQTEAVH
jgi:hypothetical protein